LDCGKANAAQKTPERQFRQPQPGGDFGKGDFRLTHQHSSFGTPHHQHVNGYRSCFPERLIR